MLSIELRVNFFFLKSNSNSMHMQVLKLEFCYGENILCVRWISTSEFSDDLTNIWSQFNNNFAEYAFLAIVTSFRSFKGCYVAWFMVSGKKFTRIKI